MKTHLFEELLKVKANCFVASQTGVNKSVILLYKSIQHVLNVTRLNQENAYLEKVIYFTYSLSCLCLIQSFHARIKDHLSMVCCLWLQSSKTQTKVASLSHRWSWSLEAD